MQSKDELKARYYAKSAEECAGACGCCTLHGCAMCMLVLWLIGGVITFYFAYLFVEWVSDGDYVTLKGANANFFCDSDVDTCCLGNEDLWGTDGTVYIADLTCEEVETIYTIQMISSALQIIASIVGIIGICSFIVFLLLAPLGYSVVVVAISLYFMFFFEDYVSYLLSIAISCLIVYLFYRNYKIAKAVQDGEI